MDERELLIKKLIEEKGGSRKDYLSLLDAIAHHESAGTLDPKLKQYGGGPGRGKYQFEVGKNKGGITAAKRTQKYFKEKNLPVPEWLQKATAKEDLDVSNLSSEQQDILFLGNMRQHPRADFSKVWSGKESVTDFWANYHWAGPDKERKQRVDSFNTSYSELNNKKDNRGQLIKDIDAGKFDERLDPRGQLIKDIDAGRIKIDTPQQSSVDSTSDFKPIPNFMGYLSQNVASLGGQFNSSNQEKIINEFNGGGTHEQNPLGGIPQGIGNNGKQNTVEENETSYELKGGKYIFSNRLTI